MLIISQISTIGSQGLELRLINKSSLLPLSHNLASYLGSKETQQTVTDEFLKSTIDLGGSSKIAHGEHKDA